MKKLINKSKEFITTLLNGKEVNDPTPTVVYTDLNRPLSLQEQINRVIRARISQDAYDRGFETEEEAQDFNVEDNFTAPDPNTVYQVMDEEIPLELQEKKENLISGVEGASPPTPSNLDVSEDPKGAQAIEGPEE